MATAFGFSIGDFLAALQLVGTVIDALRESGPASREYRDLLQQLYALETALLRVKRLEADDAPANEIAALKETASNSQRTINEFWKKLQPYESSMRATDSNRLRDKWLRVKWSVCHKDDIKKFKADLTGHTEGILLLLTTIQMSTITLQTQRQRTLAGRIQDSYFQCMSKLGMIYTKVSTGVEQGKQLFSMTSQVLRTNIQIFQAVMQIQDIVTRITGQIERQQPVFLIDAFGRTSPFYLEFIRSTEAFKAVLMANFREAGAAEKIENNEFAIEDVATQADIDLSKEWTSVFNPGQRVEMSMVFTDFSRSQMRCPSCGSQNNKWDIEIHW
jgi:Fungal N-terminal domain of STAND proteins